MVREALQDKFLKTLAELGGSAGNGRLQTELGWQDDTYWRVQPALVEEGLIVKGRGRGGSVALADGVSPSPRPSPIKGEGARQIALSLAPAADPRHDQGDEARHRRAHL
jgi:type I restriction enzyme M protein